MTKITITGTTVTFTSSVKMEDIKKVCRYNPAATQLVDDNDNVTFTMIYGDVGMTTDKCIVYNAETPDGSGLACVSVGLPSVDGKTAQAAVAEVFGPMVAKANKVEAQIADALTEINGMLASVEGAITIC